MIEVDVVLADLTETNANVMYEIGIRQALMKPLILMAEKGQKLPFDLNDQRTIFYQLDLEHFEQAQQNLQIHLSKALSGEVDPLDQALFSSERKQPNNIDSTQNPSRDFLAVLEVCENVLNQTQQTRELLTFVGQIVVQLYEGQEAQDRIRQKASNQQMGMMFMNQLFQHPETAEKIIPAMQKFMEMGKIQNNRSSNPSKKNSCKKGEYK